MMVEELRTRPHESARYRTVSAAQIGHCSFSHLGRCRSHAAFAKLAGTSPLEASSGQSTRHPAGGDFIVRVGGPEVSRSRADWTRSGWLMMVSHSAGSQFEVQVSAACGGARRRARRHHHTDSLPSQLPTTEIGIESQASTRQCLFNITNTPLVAGRRALEVTFSQNCRLNRSRKT